jgi:uracil-DNA glycosylase
MYVEEDIDQNSTVYDALFATYYDGWTDVFEKYRPHIKNISKIIERKENEFGGFLPQKCDLFRTFGMTDLRDVKVVIWGKNPCVSKNFYGNIFKELKQEKQVPDDFDGEFGRQYLDHWASQGVLFMNVSMCYSRKNPDPYADLWIRFANIIIQVINNNVPNCIHLLWGRECEKIADSINSREVYSTSHPSSPTMGFFGCNHFIKTNITLARQNKSPINWFH